MWPVIRVSSSVTLVAVTAVALAAALLVRTTTDTTCEGLPSNAGNRGLISDCEHLLAIRDRLAGTSTYLSNWNLGTPMEEWQGVVIEGSPKRVTKLKLGAKGLTGHVSALTGDLTALTELRLRGNTLTGKLPTKLAQLTNLTHLRVGKNSFTGCVPPSLRDVVSNDLADLGLSDCPPPTNVSSYFRKVLPPGTYYYNSEFDDLTTPLIIFDIPPGIQVVYAGVAWNSPGLGRGLILEYADTGIGIHLPSGAVDELAPWAYPGASGASDEGLRLLDLVGESVWVGR